MAETQKQNIKLLKRTCPICLKKFTSLYDKQLESNFNEHMRTHEGDKLK